MNQNSGELSFHFWLDRVAVGCRESREERGLAAGPGPVLPGSSLGLFVPVETPGHSTAIGPGRAALCLWHWCRGGSRGFSCLAHWTPRNPGQLKLEHLLAVSAVFIGILQPSLLPLRAAVPCVPSCCSHGIPMASSWPGTDTRYWEETEAKGCLKSWALELCPQTSV